MRAALFHGSHQPLTIEIVPTPTPAPDEVLVRVAACGVCHTDLHYLDHGSPTFKRPPLILGHEISGTIAGLGSPTAIAYDGEPLRTGDHVLLPAVLPCGQCAMCRAGRENICERMRMFGNHLDGGYAEYVTAPAKDIFRLPNEIPLVEGATIADASTTPYHAVVHRGHVVPGDWVAVVGCGGIGANIVQMATAIGARVVAVDISDEKLAWAERLGAVATFNPQRVERLDKQVRTLTSGGVTVAFEAIGKPRTQELAFDLVRIGGRLVLVGFSPDAMTFNSGRVMFREMDVVGSLGCRPLDYPRVIEMARRGQIKVAELVTHRFSLDDIQQAFDTLRAGKAMRAVVTP